MKIVVNFLLLCLIGYHANCQQTYSYEMLDSISVAINKIQKEADGERVVYQPYRWLKHNFQINFPEDAFRYFFYNQKAIQAYYRDDTLTLIQDLDLSMATNIYMPGGDDGLVRRVVVEFSTDVKKQAYLQGREVGIGADDKEFDFFCKESRAGERYKQRQLFDLLVNIISRMKIAKKMITQAEANEWQEKGEAAMLSSDKAIPLAYVNKYPDSYYKTQVLFRYYKLSYAERAKANEKEELKKATFLDAAKNDRERVLQFLDSLAASFHFKRDLTELEFRKYNAEVREAMLDTTRWGNFYARNKNATVGPISFKVNAAKKVINYNYAIAEGKGAKPDEFTSKYLNLLRNSPAAPYLKIVGPNKFGNIEATVYHPLIDMILRIYKYEQLGPIHINFEIVNLTPQKQSQ